MQTSHSQNGSRGCRRYRYDVYLHRIREPRTNDEAGLAVDCAGVQACDETIEIIFPETRPRRHDLFPKAHGMEGKETMFFVAGPA